MSMKRRSRARWHRRLRAAIDKLKAEWAVDGNKLTHVNLVVYPDDPTDVHAAGFLIQRRAFEIEFFTYPEGAPMSGEKVNF